MTVPFVLYQTTPHWLEVFSISFAVWIAMEFWIGSRDRRAASGERKDRGSMLLIFLAVWTGISIAFTAPYAVRWAYIPLPRAPLFWTAIALIWVGIVLRLWAVLTLGKFFRMQVHIQDEHRLVTRGPYRFLRHPSYTGGLLTVTGIGLAMGNWISVAGAFLCLFLAYCVRILVEEKALKARFGEAFVAHKKRTWAVIPPLW